MGYGGSCLPTIKLRRICQSNKTMMIKVIYSSPSLHSHKNYNPALPLLSEFVVVVRVYAWPDELFNCFQFNSAAFNAIRMSVMWNESKWWHKLLCNQWSSFLKVRYKTSCNCRIGSRHHKKKRNKGMTRKKVANDHLTKSGSSTHIYRGKKSDQSEIATAQSGWWCR